MKLTMANSNWIKKSKDGEIGERIVESFLAAEGHNVIRSEDVRQDGNLLYWDLQIDNGTRFEVKYDVSGYEYMHKYGRDNPNLFIEWWSTTRNEKCGIFSSIGEADVFVYIFKETNRAGEFVKNYAHTFYLEDFAIWCNDCRDSWKDVTCYLIGNENARGWLVNESVMLKNKHLNGYIKTIQFE